MDDERADELAEPSGGLDVEAFEQDGPDLFGLGDPEPSGAEPLDLLPEAERPDAGATTSDTSDSFVDEDGQPASKAVMEAFAASREPFPDPAGMQRPDAPLALYRRYRPDTFADIIGQQHITEPLQRALVANRVNHAYLFSGPRGCGKTTSARILARALNCAKGPTAVPCGQCQSCRDLARGGPGSIDVIEIDAASHGGVDDARDLRERAFFAPVNSRYKIYIVDEAHMVTPAGFNALLKVVEEPPAHVKFIFATTEPEKVIGTIRSRTHHYPFRLVPPKTLSGYLASLCEAEGVAVDPAALPLVVRAGAGSVRDSLSVLDQLLGGAGDHGVTYTQAAALLGYTPDTLLDEIVDAFAAGDGHGVFACIDKVIEVGQDPRRFAEDLLRRLRDLIVVAAVPDALTSGLVDVAADQADRLRGQATTLGPGELTRAAEVIATGLTEMRGTTAPRLHLELMCARVLLPAADAGDRGVHARLDRLERRFQMTAPEARADLGGAASEAARPAATQPSTVPPPVAVLGAPYRSGSTPWSDEQAAELPAPGKPNEARTARQPADSAPSSAPRTRVPAAPADAPPAQPPARSTDAPDPSGPLTTVDFRRLWPDILTEVKSRRRFTWILLSQNAHVLDVVDGVLSLAMNNAGARDSFGRGGSEDVLREAILQVTATQVSIQVVVEPASSDSVAAATPTPTAATPPRSERPAAAVEARQNLRATSTDAEATPAEQQPSRDDASVEELTANHDELLAKHLGAELIAEEE